MVGRVLYVYYGFERGCTGEKFLEARLAQNTFVFGDGH